jgi:hypothetical protein
MPKLPATPLTPVENCRCDECDYRLDTVVPAKRWDAAEFAHCTECGSTDLRDDRSPFEALVDAVRWEAAATDINRRIVRQDFARTIKAIADQADPNHCADCTHFARIAR